VNIKHILGGAALALACLAVPPVQAKATSSPAGVSARQLVEQGDARLKRAEVGPAILAFERARVLAPGSATDERLARARAQAGLEAEPSPPLVARLPLGWRTLGAAALLALFWVGLAGFYSVARRRWLVRAAVACGAVGLLLTASVGWEVLALRRVAIVTASTPVQVSPFRGAASEGAFRPGERVRVVGRYGDFVEVSDGGSRHGWVEAARVETITS
jgi:hypothetical protein